ncbi:hypothetical protein K0B04_01355 [Patescibacteria group bacterium]|nr:hypothetical protein [Patescibacteria group bacterium]
MSNLLKDIYNKMEGIKGRKLFYTILGVFISFTLIGISIGYLISPRLIENENGLGNDYDAVGNRDSDRIEAEGRVTYVNPELYPMDDISYSLTDSSGKELYLLQSRDQKLRIAEGLFVKVVGKMGKLSDKSTDVFIVEEVIINSVSD